MNQNLVTLAQAQRHLKRDEDQVGQPDPDLEIMIAAASQLIFTYLKDYVATFTDTAGYVLLDSSQIPIVPPVVRSATLVTIGYFDRNRDADVDEAFAKGDLPAPVRAILGTVRVPTIA